MCSNKVDDKTTLPKKKTRRSKRKCYGCNEKGHEIASCLYMKNEGLMSSRKRLTGKEASKKQDEKASCKDKHRICYTCRAKGHIGKNCPIGNIPKPNSFNNDQYLPRNVKSGTYVAKVISSSHANAKAIWVPKSFMTNLKGPNMVWVPQSA
jgi:hypothetical protein